MSRVHYVYIIEAFDKSNNPLEICKVGRSVNPVKRVAELNTGCPYSLQLHSKYAFDFSADAQRIEMLFRWNFQRYRMNGEWFSMKATDVKWQLESLTGKNPAV